MHQPMRLLALLVLPLALSLVPMAAGAQIPDSALARLELRIEAMQAQLDSLRSELDALGATPVPAPPPGGAFTPAARTKTDGCLAHQPLPDPGCTPGAIMTRDLDTICNTSTRQRRDVTPAVERAVYAAYGVHYPQPRGSIELDHLISLELGGDNTADNLWPEFATPRPGFHEKDLIENELHRRVCAGEMTLEAAQRTIATDWLGFYRSTLGH